MMPRNTFTVSALGGASPGLTALAASIGGGAGTYQRGYDGEIAAQSKLAQALAAMRASDAAAADHNARADQTRAETSILNNRGAVLDESLAASTGATLPLVAAVRQYLNTGVRPMAEQPGPPTEAGVGPADRPVVDDATQSNIMRELARQATLRTNLKDTSPDSWQKAQAGYREQDLSDAIIAGRANRNTVAGAQAAADGKPLYHFDGSGLVGDLFSGGLNESSGTAQAGIALRKEQAGAQRANAAQSYASADNSRASAAKTRQETEQGGKTGDIQLVTDNEGNVSLVNKRTGISRPATNADGVPLKGKSAADKPLPEGAQKQVVGTRNLQAAVDGYLAALNGWTNKDMLIPDRRAAMGNAYNNMMLQAKEAYNLGVLNGPDYEILQSVVKDPTKPTSGLVSNEALGNQARELKRIGAQIEKTVLESHGKPYTPRPDSAPQQAVPTATNPATGEKIQLVNGAWVPVK